jgi:hypothetical protein
MGFPVFLNLRRISAKLAAVQKLERYKHITEANKSQDELLLFQPQLLADLSFLSQTNLRKKVMMPTRTSGIMSNQITGFEIMTDV